MTRVECEQAIIAMGKLLPKGKIGIPGFRKDFLSPSYLENCGGSMICDIHNKIATYLNEMFGTTNYPNVSSFSVPQAPDMFGSTDEPPWTPPVPPNLKETKETPIEAALAAEEARLKTDEEIMPETDPGETVIYSSDRPYNLWGFLHDVDPMDILSAADSFSNVDDQKKYLIQTLRSRGDFFPFCYYRNFARKFAAWRNVPNPWEMGIEELLEQLMSN